MNPRLANDERGLTWTIKNDKITSFIPFKAANEQTTSKYDQDADGVCSLYTYLQKQSRQISVNNHIY